MRARRYLLIIAGFVVLLVMVIPNTFSSTMARPSFGQAPDPAAWLYLPILSRVMPSPTPAVAYKTYGLSFSPFTRPGQDPNRGTVVEEAQIRELIEKAAPYTNWVRTFGVTNGLEKVGPIAHEHGLKVAAGAWLGDPAYSSAVNEEQIASLIRIGQAGHADLLIVGSETLYRGDLTEAKLIEYISRVKQAVPGLPVATADVYDRLLARPAVIAAGDVVLPNYYPYWVSVGVNDAVAEVSRNHQRVVAAAGGRPVIVSETGWPSAGNQYGQAVASPENASLYFLNFVSWARAGSVPYFYFEAFDEPWKQEDTRPEEAHFGIWDRDGNMKPGMKDVFDGKTSQGASLP